ncbi:MAG: hypothetical protein ACFFHD_11305 [Promethearchaeota archaeon]
MSEDQKTKVHPIVERALEMAYKGLDPVEFDDYAVEQLQELLKQHFGKPDLLKAVIDLINLAGILDEKGCHSASMKLIIVVSTAADALKEWQDRYKDGNINYYKK